MNAALLGSLVVLALIDSTSFGTLLIPIWLLLHPGPVRPGRMLVFLGTVAGFYLVVGVALALGATAFLPQLTALLDTRAASWAQLVVGVALFILSFRLGRRQRPEGAGRMARWRERALGTADTGTDTAGAGSGRATGALVGLALTAAVVEVGTMLPYLAAIGLITTAHLALPQTVLAMAGYCLVMVTPALALLGLRLTVGRRIDPALTRVSAWMASSETLSWVLGIVGFLLAWDAVDRLGLLGALVR